MIKLIASDMDGTFLDGNECVPEGSYDLVMRLRDAGIQFVASSGRRFDTLHELFEPVVDCMDFVASNGAQVMVAGELVDLEVFSHAAVKRLARVVDMFDTMHLALFDETRSYLLDDEARFEREVDKNLPNPVRVFDVPSPQTSILKASVYCHERLRNPAHGGNERRHGQRSVGHQADRHEGDRHERRPQRPARASRPAGGRAVGRF